MKTTGFGTLGLALGGVAFRVGTGWWDQAPGSRLAVLSSQEALIVDAIADALFPGDAEFPNGKTVGVVAYVDRTIAALDDRSGNMLRLLLHALDDGAVLADFGMKRFHRRPREERIAILDAWDDSWFSARRGSFRAIKLLVSTAYCEHPDVLSAVGIHYTCGGQA